MRTERTALRRQPGRGSHERAAVHGVLDEARVCHLGFVVDGQPYVIPTLHARCGERLYLHGAVANRALGVLAAGAPCCVTATLIDGLVLARSAFHHSMNYRSVVVLGRAAEVTDPAEKRRALAALVDRALPGRSAACRPPNQAELRATRVLALPLEEASAKARRGPPVEDEADLALPHWGGVVPLRTTAGAPEPDAHVAPGTPFPHDLGPDAGGAHS